MSVTTGFAQSSTKANGPKKSCSCAFSSINQFGLLTGERDPAIAVQSINGFRYKTWFAGAGIGLDSYKRIGIPLFLDIRKDLWGKTNTPFLYADGGYHLITDGRDKSGGSISKYTGGLYYDMGFGYKLAIKDKQAFLISAGYSVKNLTEKQYWDLGTVDVDGYRGTYQYRLNRLFFKAGLQF
jgi:hypothetical protein